MIILTDTKYYGKNWNKIFYICVVKTIILQPMAGEVNEQYRIPVSELNALTALFADHISTSVPRMAPSPKQTKYNHMWISMDIEECVPTPPNNALTSFLHNGGEYTMYCPGEK
jgi:hypothetical protein